MQAKDLTKGFGLLEALIALFVIVVGALGLTRAQFSTLQSANDAGLRTTANILLQDMAARIQANSGNSALGLTSGYRLGTGFGPKGNGLGLINNNCLSSTGSICTGNEMAIHDLGEWNQNITNSFTTKSGAFGLVCLEATPGDPNPTCATAPGTNPYPVIYTVKIFWKSFKNQDNTTFDQSVVTTVEAVIER